jgi:hypothetical protein
MTAQRMTLERERELRTMDGSYEPPGPLTEALDAMVYERFRADIAELEGDGTRHMASELETAIRGALQRGGFRIAPDLMGQETIWCTECGRDSGYHWTGCKYLASVEAAAGVPGQSGPGAASTPVAPPEKRWRCEGTGKAVRDPQYDAGMACPACNGTGTTKTRNL